MAILAVIISIGAFAVSVYEARIMKDQQAIMQSQQKASVWPFLEADVKFDFDSSRSTAILDIKNNGVGPARIKSFFVTIDGKRVEDPSSLGDFLEPLWKGDEENNIW